MTGKGGGYQVAAAVLGSMSGTVPGSTDADRARNFAKQLMDRWGVGDHRCLNGVLLLLAVEDRQVYIATGAGARDALTDQEISVVIDRMRPHLRAGDVGDAVLVAASYIRKGLEGDISPPPPPPSSSGDFSFSDLLVMLGFLSVFVTPFALIVCCACRANRRHTRDVGRVDELLRRMERGEGQARQVTYFASSCPICLDDFGSNVVAPTDVPEPSAPPPPDGASPSAPLLGGDKGTGSAGGSSVRYPEVRTGWGLFGGGVRARSRGRSGTDEEGQARVDADADADDAPRPAAPPPPLDRRGPEHGAVYLPCGHGFCGRCISQHLRGTRGGPQCPICRATFDANFNPTHEPPRSDSGRPGCYGAYRRHFYRGLDYDLWDLEYRYRLDRMHHRYRYIVPHTVVPRDATVPRQNVADVINAVREAERARAVAREAARNSGHHSSGRTTTSFGGGHSRGGGGGGGSW